MADGYSLDIRLDRVAISRLMARVSYDAATRAGTRTLMRAQDNLVAGNHNNTGKTSRSLFALVENNGASATVTVGSPLRHAFWLDQGRGPVFAKPGKWLVFMPRGGTKLVFAKKVKAAKPTYFLTRAAKSLRPADFAE